MVHPGCEDMDGRKMMSPESQRRRNLHNFSFLSSWGYQRQLLCSKTDPFDVRSDDEDEDHSPPPSLHRRFTSSKSSRPNATKLPEAEQKQSPCSEFEKVQRFRLRVRLPAAAETGRRSDQDGGDRKSIHSPYPEMDGAKFAGKEEVEHRQRPPLPPPPLDKTTEASMAEARPWNLRKKRRAVCKEHGGEVSCKCVVESEKKPRARFSVALTKQEIEEDFIAITGRKPPKKQKKRSRAVQKQLGRLFPGFWLTEITDDMYVVNENLKG